MSIFVAVLFSLAAMLFAAISLASAHGYPLRVDLLLPTLISGLVVIWTSWVVLRRRRFATARLAAVGMLVLYVSARVIDRPTPAELRDRAEQLKLLDGIRLGETSVEPLASDSGGQRFALTYALTFPQTGRYSVGGGSIGAKERREFGYAFRELEPAIYERGHLFEAIKPYRFTLVFDTQGKAFDFGEEKATVQVCTDTRIQTVCNGIEVDLRPVIAAFASNPQPRRLEPEAPADSVRILTRNSIRLADLSLRPGETKRGEPLHFSYAVVNTGDRAVPIPDGNFGNVIVVGYAWEPISDSAKKTTTSHAGLDGRVFAGVEFVMQTVPQVAPRMFEPGEREAHEGKISPFDSLLPGDYRLHVELSSRFSTMPEPIQTLTQDFSIIP
jgi:hypothetical protein